MEGFKEMYSVCEAYLLEYIPTQRHILLFTSFFGRFEKDSFDLISYSVFIFYLCQR